MNRQHKKILGTGKETCQYQALLNRLSVMMGRNMLMFPTVTFYIDNVKLKKFEVHKDENLTNNCGMQAF